MIFFPAKIENSIKSNHNNTAPGSSSRPLMKRSLPSLPWKRCRAPSDGDEWRPYATEAGNSDELKLSHSTECNSFPTDQPTERHCTHADTHTAPFAYGRAGAGRTGARGFFYSTYYFSFQFVQPGTRPSRPFPFLSQFSNMLGGIGGWWRRPGKKVCVGVCLMSLRRSWPHHHHHGHSLSLPRGVCRCWFSMLPCSHGHTLTIQVTCACVC